MAHETLPHLDTADEISADTGLPEWRLYELARRGLIPHVRLGRSVRFSRSAVAEWIARGGTADSDEL